MNEPGKSDSRVVPEKVPNKAGRPAAEGLEGRRLAKRNSPQADTLRTQGRARVHAALGRVRQAAEAQKGVRFTALLHHIYAIDTLRAAYYTLKRDAAPGVDGETWGHYGEALEEHLGELSDRVRRGAYRPQPVRRAYVPKRDGQQRPIGVMALEDKIVQRATAAVLNAIYETECAGFSYGARPGRSAHQHWRRCASPRHTSAVPASGYARHDPNGAGPARLSRCRCSTSTGSRMAGGGC
jgi:RNA-directed DNA polymerase